jgi:hypothetical protein
MMKVIVVLCAMAIAGTSSTLAAPVKKAPQLKTVAEKQLPYALAPLDPAVGVLPSGYLGHSCRSIAKAVSTIRPQKSEFETTSAYKARVDASGSARMVGTTSLSDAVGFVQSTDVYTGVSEIYDADRGLLKVRAHWDGQTKMVNNELLRFVRLDEKIKSNRSYAASNAYGKKVEVDSSRWDVCAVAFSNLTYSSLLISRTKNIDEPIEMSPDDARLAKGNLALMFVGNMSEPYLSEFHDYSKPTIDNPNEMASSGDLLIMKLVQVWIFNRKTGAIYKKIDI